MARVSLVTDSTNPELAELAGRLRSGRGGSLLHLYQVLLHSPGLAEGWFNFNTAVRWHTELDGALRELVIIRIGYLNGSAYALRQHVPGYALAEGLTLAQCDALADWEPTALFTAPQRAALAYTDALTRDIEAPDAVFAALRPHYSERQIVELTVLIGMYNMHTRVTRALAVDLEPR